MPELDHIRIELKEKQKIYFLSDFHLGSPDHASSRERENRIVSWISEHEADMAGLFLLGDIFDYWFEYRFVVPKGFVRLFGKIAALTDRGIPVHFFCGNHDTWLRGYFEEEMGISTHKGNALLQTGGRCFLVGHGDGLGPKEKGYKFIKKVFNAKPSKVLYAALHPCWGFLIARNLSRRSRKKSVGRRPCSHRQREKGKNFNLLCFMEDFLRAQHVDGFIFGHRHWPLIARLEPGKPLDKAASLPGSCARWHGKEVYYLNTGDWLRHDSFASFNGESLCLFGKNLKEEFV